MSEDHEKYLLRVTAGPDYDQATQQIVPVNSSDAVEIDNEHVTARLRVNIQGYKGLPHNSPSTSPYFTHANHTHDQYSIAFSFIPKTAISGDDLVFGNDLDRPIRDRLPPGFSTAMRIATWFIDPGLDGDPYADKPYLYGPALSSLNVVRVGEKVSEMKGDEEAWKLPGGLNEDLIVEGGDGEGETIRSEKLIPADAEKRKKWFLDPTHRQDFEFEAGRVYQADFFNPYVVFNDFSVKLPGFSVSVLKYVDEKTHELRYVLKNKKTGDVLFVVLFTLLFVDPQTPPEGNGNLSANRSRDSSRKSSDRRSLRSVASSAKGKVKEKVRRSSGSPKDRVRNGSMNGEQRSKDGSGEFEPRDDDVD